MSKLKRRFPSPTLLTARSFLSSQNYFAILLVILLVTAIRLPIDYKRMMTITDNDYTLHIYYALDMLAGRPVPAFQWAHPLWELVLIGVWWLSRCRIDFWQSAIGIQVVSSIASALIVYFWFGALPGRPSAWVRAFWAVTLVLVTPVSLPTLLDGAYYFGYIALADYHSPTVHVLRPFALIMFIFGIKALSGSPSPWWQILISAVTVVAATLFKPNYTITLFPALGVMAICWMIMRRSLDWKLLIFGLGLPGVLVLGAQYALTFINGDPGAKILMMPLVVAQALSGYLAIKFFLSILFPLVISAVLYRWVRQDLEMLFAWLGFAAGAAQFYLLAELPGLTHANFLWGTQISLFVLFAVTIRFLLRQDVSLKRLSKPRVLIQYLAYLPHLLAGIAYYIFCYLTPHYG